MNLRVMSREKLTRAHAPAERHGVGDLVEIRVDECGCQARGRVLDCDVPGWTKIAVPGAGKFLVANDRITSIASVS